jgi:hypothetical protein
MILRDQPPIAHFMRLRRTLPQQHMIYMVSMRKRVFTAGSVCMISACGTKRTCRRGPSMSVVEG